MTDPTSTIAGNDYLHGGTGNDWLIGGAGSDTYVFNVGDGVDTIQETTANQNDIDTLVLGPGINPNQVTVQRVRNGIDLDLAVSISPTDTVWIKNYFATGNQTQVEYIKFADGTVWTNTDISNRLAARRRQPGSPYNVLSGPSRAHPALKCPIQGIPGLLASARMNQNPIRQTYCWAA